MLDDLVCESICKDFAGKRWNRDTRGFSFEDIAEMLEVTVSSTNGRRFELECGDVCLERVSINS